MKLLVVLPAFNEAENLPKIGENGRISVQFYYLYYGTMAMFQMGGDHWKTWNEHMRDSLVGLQNKTPDDNQGSWEPEGGWANDGGRAYSTSMAILSLEVYYRYLPMYH